PNGDDEVFSLGSDEMKTVAPPPTPPPSAPPTRVPTGKSAIPPPPLDARSAPPPLPRQTPAPSMEDLNKTVIRPVPPEVLEAAARSQSFEPIGSAEDPNTDWTHEFDNEGGVSPHPAAPLPLDLKSPVPGSEPPPDPAGKSTPAAAVTPSKAPVAEDDFSGIAEEVMAAEGTDQGTGSPVQGDETPTVGQDVTGLVGAKGSKVPPDGDSGQGQPAPGDAPGGLAVGGDDPSVKESQQNAPADPEPLPPPPEPLLPLEQAVQDISGAIGHLHPDLKSMAIVKWLQPLLHSDRGELKKALETLKAFPQLKGAEKSRLQGVSGDFVPFIARLIGEDVPPEAGENRPALAPIPEAVRDKLRDLTGRFWLEGKFTREYKMESDGR